MSTATAAQLGAALPIARVMLGRAHLNPLAVNQNQRTLVEVHRLNMALLLDNPSLTAVGAGNVVIHCGSRERRVVRHWYVTMTATGQRPVIDLGRVPCFRTREQATAFGCWLDKQIAADPDLVNRLGWTPEFQAAVDDLARGIVEGGAGA